MKGGANQPPPNHDQGFAHAAMRGKKLQQRNEFIRLLSSGPGKNMAVSARMIMPRKTGSLGSALLIQAIIPDWFASLIITEHLIN